jgi:hypothetical protein
MVLLSACSPNNVAEDKTLKKHFDAYQVDGIFSFLITDKVILSFTI